jgi:hypothetical protein
LGPLRLLCPSPLLDGPQPAVAGPCRRASVGRVGLRSIIHGQCHGVTVKGRRVHRAGPCRRASVGRVDLRSIIHGQCHGVIVKGRRVHRARTAWQCSIAAFLQLRVHRLSSALPALERRLVIYDEGGLLPTPGASTFSVAMPNRLGGVDHSDDCQRLLVFAAPEDTVQFLKPSEATPEPRSGSLQERAACVHEPSASASD